MDQQAPPKYEESEDAPPAYHKALIDDSAMGKEPQALCPYKGCGKSLVEYSEAFDAHTAQCVFGAQYRLSAFLDSHGRAREEKSTDDVLAYHETAKEKPPDTLIHTVTDGDTIAGICVKYGTTKGKLLRLNKMMTDNIFARNTLLVPRPADWKGGKDSSHVPDEVLKALRKRRIANMLARKASIDLNQAVTYLHLNRYHLDKAMQSFQEDAIWTMQHSSKQPQTITEFFKRRKNKGHRCCGCDQRMQKNRSHCGACGKIFCSECCGRGDCSYLLSKFALGVTNPLSRDKKIEVCQECFLLYNGVVGAQQTCDGLGAELTTVV